VVACRNGATLWYFPGASYNKADNTIQKLDITAGSAVIHLMEYNIGNQAQRNFWGQQAKNVGCGETPAATDPKGLEQPQQQPQAVNAGMIAGAARPRSTGL
jgi:hypothetical protein